MHGIAATKFGPNRLDIFWTDSNFRMLQRTWDGTQWLGWYQLGGRFTTVPAVVASMAIPPIVFTEGDLETAGGGGTGGGGGVGGGGTVGPFGTFETLNTGGTAPDFAGEGGGTMAPPGEPLHLGPGLLGDTILTGGRRQRIDVFGVGLDYAMYTKVLWGAGADNPGAWFNLGGTFTSAPAAIAWKGKRIDVFGLGTDHAMFQKTWNGTAWSNDWVRIGGAFSSAASVVSWGTDRLDLFARGADYTLRHRSYDGSAFTSEWQNLGGTLASEPVAVSWGPNRLDVFAIFRDGFLWHRWWDGAIWNDWESMGGSNNETGAGFISAPAAVAEAPNRLDVFAIGVDNNVYHFWGSGDSWSGPEAFAHVPIMKSAPTAISTQANRLDLFAPGADQGVKHRRFNGAAWEPVYWESLGGQLKLPTQYRFSVDYVYADVTRSLHSDTDTASASIGAGNWPTQTETQSLGTIGGTHPHTAQTNRLDFEPITVELCEEVVFGYLVVNNGSADQQFLNEALVKVGEDLVEDAVAVPVIGSLVSMLSAWLLGELGDVVFADCDGIVAVERIKLLGRDLHQKTAQGPYTVTTVHPGTDSNTGCGDNSRYRVTWSIRRV